ncbi:MAG: hypothetical protein HN576_10165 [Bacteriovoracaceae bacterium]|jgi:hypothetical protein|nr:hypothetical protein [Bacteriovoracaceae bacterium]
MRLSRALNDKIMDLRLRDKFVHEGKVTKSQLDDFLKSLPDDAVNAASVDEVQGQQQASAPAVE